MAWLKVDVMLKEDLQFTLLQARNPGDPVRREELLAFADRLGVGANQILPVDILTEDLHFEELTRRDAILVGGAGEHSVCEPAPGVKRMIELLGQVAEEGFPTFASCFGFQSLVLALGGEVVHDEENAEVGSFLLERSEAAQADWLFSVLPKQFIAQEGHKDRASRLPTEAICLARSERTPFQAIRIGDKPVYATQFHPELTQVTNRKRFERYLDHYGHVFGVAEAQRMLEAFLPSPEASSLLGRFADGLVTGEL